MFGEKCDFKIKTINADFRVDEVSLLPKLDAADKKYTYLWLRKSNYTTFEALEKIKEYFDLDFSDVSAEGLKDEDGITGQIVSVNMVLEKEQVKNFNKAHGGKETFVDLERIVGYGDAPVVAKALYGNTFCVVVRNLSGSEVETISEYVRGHRFFPFVNYYDNQRFGLPGGPYITHLLGKAICEGQWDEAFSLMQKTGNKVPEGKVGEEAFRGLNPKQVGFFVSAYNSFLWNNAVSEYLKKKYKVEMFEFPHVGELALPLVSQPISIEEFTVKGYKFDADNFNVNDYDFKRNIIFQTIVYAGEVEDDAIFANKKCITLSFFLPTGCYATMMIKQIIKQALEEK